MNRDNFLSSREQKRTRSYYSFIIVAVSCLLFMIAGGTQNIFGVFFKPVLTEFGWTRAATAGAYSLNLILSGLTGILAGRLNDKFGPRIIVTIGGIFMGLGYLLMSRVDAVWQVYLFFGVFASVGLGFIAVPLVSNVARWFSNKRGLASGIVLAGSSVGVAAIAPMATLLISNYSWRTSYLIIGLAAIVLIIIMAQFLKRAPSQMASLSSGIDAGTTTTLETQTQGHSFQQAIRTPTFWITSVMAISFGFGQQIILVHLIAHATDIGIAAVSAATILSVIGLVAIGGELSMGSLRDRIGIKRVITIIFILIPIAFVLLRFASELWMLYLFAIIFGLEYGGFVAVQSPMVADYFGLKAHGAIFGLSMLASMVGGSLGSLFAGYIFDLSGNYHWAFIISAILGLTSLILVIILKPVRK
jgi:MFS family permease